MSTTFAGAVHGTDGRPLDQIRLTGLSATGHHGVFEHERLDGQLFRADVVLHLDTRPAAAGDDLDDTVSYAVVAQDVVAVLAGSPADLVETVAERVAAVVLRHPAVEAVDVAVHKPQAPIAVPFDDVEVVIRRDRVKVPVVAAESARVVPIPVGSIAPAVLGNIGVTEVPAPHDPDVTMPPSIPPVSPPPAPDRSTDQAGFAPDPEDRGPTTEEHPSTGGVSDQEFVDALDSFYSAPQDALSAPAASFDPAETFVPVAGPDVEREPDLPVSPVAADPFSEPVPAPPGSGEPERVGADEPVGPPADVAPAASQPAGSQPAASQPAGSHAADLDDGAPAVRPAPEVPFETAASAPEAAPESQPETEPAVPAATGVPGETVRTEDIVLGAPDRPVDGPADAEPFPLPASSYAVEPATPDPAQPVAQEPVPAAPPVPVVPPATEDPSTTPEPTAATAARSEPEPAPGRALDRLDEAPTGFVPVVLALGANLGDAQQTLREAVTDLDRISGLEITDVSPLARTAAVGGPDQPDYLNAILLARTTLAPRALLHAIQGVENAHGRVRAERNGPRTLDVDLIVFGTVTELTEDLELPHPRAHERAFVLEPWAQIAPDAVLPGLGGGPVAALAATAPDRGGIRWLALDWLTDAEPEPEAAPVAAHGDAALAVRAEPSRSPQAGPVLTEPVAEAVEPEPTTAPTVSARPGESVPPAPSHDAGDQAALPPVEGVTVPFVQDPPAARPAPFPDLAPAFPPAPVASPPVTPAPVVPAPVAPAPEPLPERGADEPGPFVPAFHPVHPQDGQEPPHAQVPPLWADVSQAVPRSEPRPAALPPQTTAAAPPAPSRTVGEDRTPQFHPVHAAPADPSRTAPEPADPEQAAPQQPVRPPVTGVPMSFPADLRGPSS